MSKDQEFVEIAVKSLVQHPEDVKIERTVNELGVLITIEVNPSDVGAVIGKKGQTISALRQLLRVIGLKNRAWVSLKLLTQGPPEKSSNEDLNL
jgi:predicted RNA-binding protein YlqC (UPF0109 family)